MGLSEETQLLNGKPLIGYSIEIAKQVQAKYKKVNIALSTDSVEIANVAEELGLYSDYKRPEYLANDTVGKIDAIKDILFYTESKEQVKFDYILDLDVTSPRRDFHHFETNLM